MVSRSADGRESSIRLDINPSYTDANHPMRSVLVVEYKTYGVSNTPGSDLFDVPLNLPVQASVLCHYLLDTHCLDLYEWAPLLYFPCIHVLISVLKASATVAMVAVTGVQSLSRNPQKEAL